MKILLVFAIVLVAVEFTLASSDFVDYRLKTSTSFQCTTNGVTCKNCQELVFCTHMGGGSWEETLVQTCPRGQICADKQCGVPKNPPPCSPVDNLHFICSATGVFPDPGDCKKYHYCIENEGILQAFQGDCRKEGTGYGYNPKSTFCDIKLTNDKCPKYPLPLCRTVGESGPINENPTLYYICLPYQNNTNLLYPYQNRCPNGKVYSSEHGCV